VAGLRGRDDAPGTLGSPFRTIARLLAALRPGDVGCLLGGTYDESVVVTRAGTAGRPITLRGAPGVRARIAGAVWVTNSADWVTISGLGIDGSTAARAYAVLVQGDDVLLGDVEITNPKHDPDRVNGICLTAGHGFEAQPANIAVNLTVVHSRIHDCGDDAHEHGIYLESTRNARVVDSVIYAIQGYGISMYPDAQGSTIEYNVIDGNGGADRANVTFSGEAAGGEYSQAHTSDGNVVRFNLITNAARRYNVDSYYPRGAPSPVNNQVVWNCVWNAPFGNFGGKSAYSQMGNREVDPLFVDRAAADFSLQLGSPCSGWGPRIASRA
jgi:hypothetical protein